MNEETNRGHGFWSSKINVAAAAVVGLIIVIGLVVLLLPRGGDPDAASPGAASQPTDETTTASGDDSCPGLTDNNDTTITPGSLDDTRWELVSGFAVPSSKSWGPGSVDDGVPSCFAKTPQGAALFVGQMAGMSPAGKPIEAMEKMTVQDANQVKALDRMKKNMDQVETEGSASQIAAVRVDDFSKDEGRAAVSIVMRSGEADPLVSVSYSLRWDGDTWKMLVPSSLQAPAGEVPTLDGYTPWAGVN